MRTGFMRLFNYISGSNEGGKSISEQDLVCEKNPFKKPFSVIFIEKILQTRFTYLFIVLNHECITIRVLCRNFTPQIHFAAKSFLLP